MKAEGSFFLRRGLGLGGLAVAQACAADHLTLKSAYNSRMRDVQEVLSRLSHSPFRRRIHLQAKELAYLRRKGLREVMQHAAEFIEERLAPAYPTNDGKQTPWHNHPVFVAQHATATCCRGCLQKWHQIPKGRALTAQEQQYIVKVIGTWLSQQEGDLAAKSGI